MDETRLPGDDLAATRDEGIRALRPAGRGVPVVSRRRGIAFQLAALALILVSAVAGTGLARWLRGPAPTEAPATPLKFPGRALEGWQKPDLVLVLTGQQHGYLLPCGCSRPQVGGLERRYNFISLMKARGWPVVGLDVGDIAQRHGPAGLPNQQAMIKYVFSMRGLKAMGYRAVGFGEHEVNLGLMNVLSEYALNEPVPRVVAGNLIDAEKNYPGMTVPWEPIDVKEAGVRLGVAAVTSPTTAARIKELSRENKVQFERTPDALNRTLKEMAGKGVTLPVLLYQGPVTRNAMKRPPTEAVACAEAYPQFPVIVCLSEEDEPPSRPVEVKTRAGTTTLVLTLGRKGKFIGVVGLWRSGRADRPFRDIKYERVEMIEELETPKGKEQGHPVLDLMEQYTRELKDRDYLGRYGQVRHALQAMEPVADAPGRPTYVGSAKCISCHKKSHKIWEKTPHAHGYQTLVDATRPGNRQYDPECIVCHTVGFGYQGGFTSAAKTPHLKDVGCESCHGPSSLHVAHPNDPEWQKRINPWRHLPEKRRKDAIDQFCQKCHDQDNDVTWVGGGFERKWPLIKHYEGPDPLLEKKK